MEFAQWDLQSAVRLATLNAARVVGLDRSGCIKPGVPADLVVLSPSGEIRNTIISGAGI